MAMQRTLSIIKPDAVSKNHIGEILAMLEAQGLKLIAMRMTHMTVAEAKKFYEVHRERPFYHDLVSFISSGPVVVSVLEGEEAVKKNRDIMGATNPKEALAGTIRAKFAENIEENAVHGSDSLENAQKEIAFFFGSESI